MNKKPEEPPELAWQIATIAVIAATGKSDDIVDVDAAIKAVREYSTDELIEKEANELAQSKYRRVESDKKAAKNPYDLTTDDN